MQLVRPMNCFLTIIFVLAILQLNMNISEASILKKLKKKLKNPETCWKEKTENHCTTTYEKVT